MGKQGIHQVESDDNEVLTKVRNLIESSNYRNSFTSSIYQ